MKTNLTLSHTYFCNKDRDNDMILKIRNISVYNYKLLEHQTLSTNIESSYFYEAWSSRK